MNKNCELIANRFFVKDNANFVTIDGIEYTKVVPKLQGR